MSFEMKPLPPFLQQEATQYEAHQEAEDDDEENNGFLFSESTPLTSSSLHPPAFSSLHLTDNLDVFFRHLYEYYSYKGFSPLVLSSFFRYLSLFLTLHLGLTLLVCFDWYKLHECHLHQAECHTFSHYIFWPRFQVVSWVLSTLVGIPLIVRFLAKISLAWRYRKLYLMNQINTRELQTMQWSQVVKRLKQFQSRVPFVKNGMDITPLTVALRVMRIENYKILLFSQPSLLPLGSPSWSDTWLHWQSPIWYMGNTLERNLDWALFRSSIVHPTQFTLLRSSPDKIKNKLYALAMLNLLLMPVILVFSILFFAFEFFEEFHSKRNYLGPRFFTPHTLWLMREYNELPHHFTQRILPSAKSADVYCRQFPSPLVVITARGLAFILSSFIVCLFVFALLDDSVLLRVTVFDFNLVWFLALFTSITAGLRGLLPLEEDEVRNPHRLLRKFASFSHVLPDHWRTRAERYEVKEQLECLVPNRLVLLLREILCVLATPYILSVVLPPCVEKVLAFLESHTVDTSGKERVGDVCVYSLLRVQQDGESKWQEWLSGKPLSVPYPVQFRTVSHSLQESKVEKSYLAFKVANPRADQLHDEVGEELFRRIRQFHKASLLDQPAATAVPVVPGSILMGNDKEDEEEEFTLLSAEQDVGDQVFLGGGMGEDLFLRLEQWRDEETTRRARMQQLQVRNEM